MTAFFRSTVLALLLGALACTVTGCTGDLTEIIVVVDSDMVVPAELDSITIHVDGLGDPRDVPTDLTEPGTPELPLRLGLVNDGDRSGPISVRVTGRGPGNLTVIAVRTNVHFQRGKTLMLRVHLLRECEDMPSACAQACTNDGDCLDPWTGPPDPIDKSDAGVGGDDAGGEDAGDEDAGDAASPDASDAGPIEPCAVFGATCFNYAPSNFDPTATGAASLGRALEQNGPLNVGCLDAEFDSTTRLYSGTGECASRLLEGIEITQPGDVRALVIPLLGMAIGANGALRVVGDRPVIFAVFGDATINGPLNASADRNVPGPGGNVGCAPPPPPPAAWGETGTGQPGISQPQSNRGGSGGGGGAFGSVGGTGGRADVGGATLVSGSNPGPLAVAGIVEGDDTLIPLRGGCAGGAGGQKDANGRTFGGAGGGAVQVSAAGSLTAASVIAAGGGGGERALALEDGGGGGGSGGAILLEAEALNLTMSAWLSVNGGGGGGGFDHDTGSANAGAGANAPPNSTAGGVGGAGDNKGGRGGNGAGATTEAEAGGEAGHSDILNVEFGAGGGGGGGGVGRIRLRDNTRPASSCSFDGNVSPAASVVCDG